EESGDVYVCGKPGGTGCDFAAETEAEWRPDDTDPFKLRGNGPDLRLSLPKLLEPPDAFDQLKAGGPAGGRSVQAFWENDLDVATRDMPDFADPMEEQAWVERRSRARWNLFGEAVLLVATEALPGPADDALIGLSVASRASRKAT